MTPKRIEQERKAFEWWVSNPAPPVPIDRCQKQKDGRYAYDHIEFAWRAWQASAAQSEWISVEDRLPGIGEFVLVFRNWDGKLSQCVDRLELHHDCEKPEGEQDWYDFLYSDIYEVTHWQPLPQPPKGDPA